MNGEDVVRFRLDALEEARRKLSEALDDVREQKASKQDLADLATEVRRLRTSITTLYLSILGASLTIAASVITVLLSG